MHSTVFATCKPILWQKREKSCCFAQPVALLSNQIGCDPSNTAAVLSLPCMAFCQNLLVNNRIPVLSVYSSYLSMCMMSPTFI